MKPQNRVPAHPGVVLYEEYLQPMRLGTVDFADYIGVSHQLILDIVNGEQDIYPDLAVLIGEALETTSTFWLNLQENYDLARE